MSEVRLACVSKGQVSISSPPRVLLDAEREKLLGDAEGQSALLHLLPHQHPPAVHSLEPVHSADRVLKHCGGERRGGGEEGEEGRGGEGGEGGKDGRGGEGGEEDKIEEHKRGRRLIRNEA